MKRALFALLLFGVSFGYVEAAVVVYLRGLYEPLHERLHPNQHPGDLFPLITVEQLRASEPNGLFWLTVELGRELATLVMLASIALSMASHFRRWLAAFAIAFGAWDILFYVWLRVLLGWPESLWTWDLLFLFPVPWSGPVLAPVLVSCLMIVAGIIVFHHEDGGRALHISGSAWSSIALGGLVIVTAFCWDYRNVMAGGRPAPFNWPLFALGLGFGTVGFLHCLWGNRKRTRDVAPRQEVVGAA